MFCTFRAITVLGLLFQFIGIGLGQGPQSPCPSVFRYGQDSRTGLFEGWIRVSQVPQRTAVHLYVELSIGTEVHTEGSLKLADSTNQAIENINGGRPLLYRIQFPIQQPLPLVTRIILNKQELCTGDGAISRSVTRMTLQHTLVPSVVTEESPAVRPVPIRPYYPVDTTHYRPTQVPSNYETQNPVYYHTQPPVYQPQPPVNHQIQDPVKYQTLPPPFVVTPTESTTTTEFDWNSYNPVKYQTPPPPLVVRPTESTTTTKFDWNSYNPVKYQTPPPPLVVRPRESTTTTKFDWTSYTVTEDSSKPSQQDSTNFNRCGQPRPKVRVNLLISKGNHTERGDWPWLVALFVLRSTKTEFQCAGNLISNKHVLTAAHCLKGSDGKKLHPKEILAVLGRYKLAGWGKTNGEHFDVVEYKIHSEYGERGGFGNDLAVLTLLKTATFGPLIMPICVPPEHSKAENIVNKTGLVVGWGQDEHGNAVTPEPRIAQVPIVSQVQCLRSNADFVTITSDRTFCGGARDGSGPCNGDSGAGLMMYDSTSRRYYVRGLVSLSLLDRSTQACALSEYVVYTDITAYAGWIHEIIAS